MSSSILNSLQTQPTHLLFFSLLGLLSLSKLSLPLLRSLYTYFLRPAKDLRSHYGSWAIVTGPTDGIGKAIAFELASKNLNLILVGRNPVKLNRVSAQIKEEFKQVEIKKVVLDLSGDLSRGIQELKEEIEGLDVGVLVNNAGIINQEAAFFHEGGVEVWMEVVRVNLEAVTEVTAALLPLMLGRGRGAIVNVGSGSSTVAVPSFPFYSVYAATKAYIDQLSKSLHVEYKKKGIDVQCQIPMYVGTKMITEMRTSKQYSFLVASTNAYARAAVRWIGYEKQCIPYLPHFVQYCCARLMPEFIHNVVVLHMNMS